MNWRAALPNALTLGNLACGFAAIAIARPDHLDNSIVLLLFAMVFDALDGAAARMLKADSPLGGQLDSLADVVSFGVAPAVLHYHLQLPYVNIDSLWILLCLSLLPLGAAYRLARFNIETHHQSPHFQGLPSPAAGLLALALIADAIYSAKFINGRPLLHLHVLIPSISLIALAMVSKWPFLSLKGKISDRLSLIAVFTLAAIGACFIHWRWRPWLVIATLALYAVVSRALIRPPRPPRHAPQ